MICFNCSKEGCTLCELVKSGDKLNAMITKAQDIIRAYIMPDSGISEHDALSDLIGVFDCPEQHSSQKNWNELRTTLVGEGS